MYFSTRFILIFIYVISIQSFVFFLKFIDYLDSYFCFNCTENDSFNIQFDYIIVGCGSAGAVVARRLAEDTNQKILVLEAGKQGNSLLNIPSIGLLLQNTPYDWQYVTAPQTSACFALNDNASRWPMGKIVGGTSMLNNMVYVRGHQNDFREWFHGKKDYNFTKDVLPYFKKVENEMSKDDVSGSVYVNDLIFKSSLSDFIMDAANYLGYPISDVTNCMQGFGPPKVNIREGKRWTSSHRLLTLNQPNVLIRTGRAVQKILFHDNFEADGVEYSYLDRSYVVKASKGIILSAGVIGTPKILLLSGIGPRSHLNELSIPSKLDLPVGENLQDHVTTGFDLVLLNRTLDIGIEQMLSPSSVFNYFIRGTGPWTTAGCEGLAFFNTDGSDDAQSPDLQFMVMPLGINEDNGMHLRHLIGISDDTWNNYFAYLNDKKAMTILPILLHPRSRGTVRLRDTNVKSSPIIDPKYLTEQTDVNVLVRGIELIKKLINTPQMRELGAELNGNLFPGCEGFKFDVKDYWGCYVRRLTLTSYHPVGTCKMGHESDETTVVNYDFQVKGTSKLYVVDASVMPSLTSGNVNAAILMLAEMASDVIKYKNYMNQAKSSMRELFISNDVCLY